jgi:hypothetical protein
MEDDVLTYLRSLAARIAGRLGRLAPPPDEPDTAVREPRRRTPGGRSSAVAVAEPGPPSHVRAVSPGVSPAITADASEYGRRDRSG